MPSPAASSGRAAASSIDGFFRLTARGASVGREVMAGATTSALAGLLFTPLFWWQVAFPVPSSRRSLR